LALVLLVHRLPMVLVNLQQLVAFSMLLVVDKRAVKTVGLVMVVQAVVELVLALKHQAHLFYLKVILVEVLPPTLLVAVVVVALALLDNLYLLEQLVVLVALVVQIL
jgi:hypothetical protein